MYFKIYYQIIENTSKATRAGNWIIQRVDVAILNNKKFNKRDNSHCLDLVWITGKTINSSSHFVQQNSKTNRVCLVWKKIIQITFMMISIFSFFSAYVLTKYSEPNNNHLPLLSQRSFGNQEQVVLYCRWFAEFLYFRNFQKWRFF